MAHTRMAEAAINASLDAFLHDAQKGDLNRARGLHGMLDKMLTEQESDEGQYWLTDHARMLLAEMHRQLSHCEVTGNTLGEYVLDAVRFRPREGHWRDPDRFVKDLRVALAVAHELCGQNREGRAPDVDAAAVKVADGGEYGHDANRIRDIYEEIADTVGGFREMTGCGKSRQ